MLSELVQVRDLDQGSVLLLRERGDRRMRVGSEGVRGCRVVQCRNERAKEVQRAGDERGVHVSNVRRGPCVSAKRFSTFRNKGGNRARPNYCHHRQHDPFFLAPRLQRPHMVRIGEGRLTNFVLFLSCRCRVFDTSEDEEPCVESRTMRALGSTWFVFLGIERWTMERKWTSSDLFLPFDEQSAFMNRQGTC